jgi:heterodisulfide reductase subunit B2
MKYLYYPGCSLSSTAKAYDESMRAVFQALDIELEELKDWNCCGATTYFSIDEKKAFALAARNLALAELQNGQGDVELVAPCSSCYLVLTKTQHYLKEYDEVRSVVTNALHAAGLEYRGKVNVRHPIDVLVNDFGLDKVSKKVTHPMKGLRIASYYGCQVVRPFATFDDALYPETMDKLMKAVGAEPVDWSLKTRCCGGSLTGTIKDAGFRLNQHLLVEATRKKADMIVTCCPLCQFNLECFQGQINKQFGEHLDVPVLFFTQLMGLALGVPEKKLGIQRLFVNPNPVLASKNGGAAVHA